MRVTDVCYQQDEPVDESRARALAVSEVVREPLTSFLDTQQRRARRLGAAGSALVVLGIVALVANAGFSLALALVLTGSVVAGGGVYHAKSREPDVQVTGVSKGYWTGYCIPGSEDGVVVYDATDSRDATEFDLELLEDQSTIHSAHERLANLQEYPVVMPSDQNLEEDVRSTLQTVQAELDGAVSHTVEAPLIGSDDREMDAIDALAPHATADPVDARTEADPSDAHDAVSSLDELESMADTADGGAALESISEISRTLASDLSGLHETAIDRINDHIQTAADAYGLVSYNFYCPDCLAEDIETVLELTSGDDGDWYCETCRDHHDIGAGIPRHCIKDDVVNPAWDQLWIEKDDQRREIYENIEDRKDELTEREFEQRSEEIRTTTDRLHDLRSKIRDLKTQAKAAEGTVDEIGDLMVKYEHLHRDRKEEFQAEVTEAFEEIDAKTERILEETRNEEQERIEQAQSEAEEKAELMREEERKREREKFIAKQRLENERAKAQMANERAVASAKMKHESELTSAEMQQEAEHHKEDKLLDVYGKLNVSDTVNSFRNKKIDVGLASKHGGEK